MAGAFQAHHLQPCTTAEIQPKSNHNHHHDQNPAKIKSHKNPKAHQITNQITSTEIKAQNPQTQPKSQNENTESEPTVKKTYIGFVIIF